MASYFHVYFYKNIKRRRAGIREYRHMKKKKILKKSLIGFVQILIYIVNVMNL
ncbi:hypothetical protein BLCOC_00190 [Blautia coccoides]|uniref:Uncharacterized protein n=1 Tax=Blautia producta TaxID=33035 RepID=A0ABZ0U379_9FIRM|nr:hypothetical protein BLCOC_00190 [Blautia coccoides]